jgi:hypothetical protein
MSPSINPVFGSFGASIHRFTPRQQILRHREVPFGVLQGSVHDVITSYFCVINEF